MFGGAYNRRGLYTEGYLSFKIDWASLLVGSKFTILALFYFVFEGNFPRTSPQGAYMWRGNLTEGFLHYRFGGLIFEFSEFYSIPPKSQMLQKGLTLLVRDQHAH